MEKEVLTWIQNWYLKQCNGDWEHSYGVRILTLDNPGWIVEINLEGTYLESIEYTTIDHVKRSEDNWMICEKKDKKFVAHGGPLNLSEILIQFRYWAEENLND